MNIKNLLGISSSAIGLSVLLIGSSQAAPTTFFGEDIHSGAGILSSIPNSNDARTSFFSNLQGVGTETFESFATGRSTPISSTFAGAGAATITGTGTVQSGASTTDQYPISGSKYYNASSGDFVINFTDPIAAFGFYGTDIGDFGQRLILTLTTVGGLTSTLTVPNTLGSNGSTSGSALYFGFYDTTTQYRSISFNNTTTTTSDVFGFDDFSVGSIRQVAPAVPGPIAGAGLIPLLGLGAAFLARRRKAAAAA